MSRRSCVAHNLLALVLRLVGFLVTMAVLASGGLLSRGGCSVDPSVKHSAVDGGQALTMPKRGRI